MAAKISKETLNQLAIALAGIADVRDAVICVGDTPAMSVTLPCTFEGGAVLMTAKQLAEHDAKVRAQALEEAALACDKRQSEYGECPETASYCAAAVRALKATPRSDHGHG